MDEFQEIAHCGGKVIITIKTDNDGKKKYSIGIRHQRPTHAAFFAVYALEQGIPVGTIQLGGIGDHWNPPPYPNCYFVFISSDSTGLFGHYCGNCKNYWRSKSAPDRWLLTCPYCGVKGKSHQFLTEGQIHFVEESCSLYNEALEQGKDGESCIDLDKIADSVNAGAEKPKFYYVGESQQNKYKCQACGDVQDILGQFGYCSCCGTRNDLQDFEEKIIPTIRDRIKSGGPYEACVRDVVSAFDSYAIKYVGQLLEQTWLTPTRKNRLSNIRFHNLEKVAEDIKEIFGIDIFKGLKLEEIKFAILMFHRRHVYEHKGGEADQKYIEDSGDTNVKPKQSLREDKTSAHQITNHILTMSKNLHLGFHSIFPPETLALKYK